MSLVKLKKILTKTSQYTFYLIRQKKIIAIEVVSNFAKSNLKKFETPSPLTNYRPAMPFGNRKNFVRGSFEFSIVRIKKITPL